MIWNAWHDLIPLTGLTLGQKTVPIFGCKWPSYGFDEFFLATAFYPRAAQEGLITYFPASFTCQHLILDVAHTIWANPASEFIPFGDDPSHAMKPGEPPLQNWVQMK